MDRRNAIRSVTRNEFDKLLPARSVISTIVLQEVEWFMDDACVVIGFVARDKTEDDWSLCVLGPNAHGAFRPIAAASGMTSFCEARSRLIGEIERALACGGLAVPDGD